MARFVTEHDGWILEVEHLEQDGEQRLTRLLSAGREAGDRLAFALDGPTGNGNGNQYFVRGLRNGTYVKHSRIRNRAAANVF